MGGRRQEIVLQSFPISVYNILREKWGKEKSELAM